MCPDCGGTFKETPSKSKLADGSTSHCRYYKCRKPRVSGKGACDSRPVRADELEAGIMEGARQFYGLDCDRDTWQEMLRVGFSVRVPDAAPDITAQQQQLVEIEIRPAAAMDRLTPENAAFVGAKLSEWRREAEALRTDIAAIEAQMAVSHDVDDLAAEANPDSNDSPMCSETPL